MVGGYWRTDHTFQPMLVISNIMESMELSVTPVLYAADHTEYDLPAVTLTPAGVSSIDIRSAIAAAPEQMRGHFTEYGSAAVKYVWHWSGAASAEVVNRDAKRSLNFGFELRSPKMTMAKMAAKHGAAATVQEGLWWREDSGVKGFLALVNVAQHPVNVQVQVLSNYGAFESERMIHLQPNETSNVDVLEGVDGSSGGIRVTYNGAENDVVVAGGLENPREGYSAQIPFVTAPSEPNSKASNVSYSSVGLMLGAPDPMMKFPASTQFGIYLALRNTTPRPVLINPTLYYMQGSDVVKAPLKTLTLAAREARHWTPKEFAAEHGLPNSSGMINLVFSYQGHPRDVIMASGSIDQTKSYVFEIIMKGVGKNLGMSLKDWDVSNGNDTMISLLNLDEKDQDFWVTLFFDGGQYKVPVQLKAGGSMMFNVSETIMMQQPDSDGHKIPPGTLHGTAVLSPASPDPQWVNVGVSVGIFNVSTATCGGHCPYCNNFTAFRVQADRSTAPVGQDTQFSSWGLSSNGAWIDYTLQSSWTSSNIQVAQPSGSTVGAFTGVSPGQFSGQAYADLPANYCPDACSTEGWTDGAPGTITGIISVSPSRGLIGATTSSVTITGVGFTGGHVNTPAAIQVANETTFTDTRIVLDLVVSSSATPGNNVGAISITVSGQTTNAKDFYVQIPANLSIATPKTGSEGLCATGACGTTTNFTYQVNDQASPPQPINAVMSYWDSFAATNPDPLNIDRLGGYLTTCGPSNNNTGPCNKFTNSSGQFQEQALGACSPVCFSNGACTTGGPSLVDQTWHIAANNIVQHISIYCERVLVNGQ